MEFPKGWGVQLKKLSTVGVWIFSGKTHLLLRYFVGTKAYEKVQEILMKTGILNDVKRLSPEAEARCLEGFHSTLNQWHPKMMCFSWLESSRQLWVKKII